MEFYLTSPEIGPYVLTCPAELASALAAGHTLLPHEDAYMGALHGWHEMKQEAAAHMAKAEREAARLAVPTNEQLASEMAAESYGAAGGDQNAIYENILARLNKEDACLEEPDYSSPEYVGKPVFEETEVETSTPVAPAKKTWTHADIKALIKRNDDAVNRAMVALSKRTDLPAWQINEVNGYAHWVGRGKNLSGRFLNKARTLALRNSRKLEEIANA